MFWAQCACHSLYSSWLLRSAAIVRDRRDILNGKHLKTVRVQRTHRRLPPRTDARDKHVNFFEIILTNPVTRIARNDARGVRRRFFWPTESGPPSRRPRQYVAMRIRQRH